MTWPAPDSSSNIATTNTDASNDSPASARTDMLAVINEVNNLKSLVNAIINYGTPALASAVNMGATAVSFSSSLSIDATTSQVFMVGTLTGNTTLSLTGTPTNGKALLFRFKQDATGSRYVTLPTGAVVAGLINPLANKVTWLTLIWVDSDSRYEGYWSALP